MAVRSADLGSRQSLLVCKKHTGTQHEGHDGLCQDGGLKHALKPGAAGIEVAQSCNILRKLDIWT